MLAKIYLQSSRRDNEDVYRAYRQIKYKVFVIEQGWHDLADRHGRAVATEDPFDDQGRFQLALSEEGLPIGVVRGVPLREDFPHRHLFAHHLSVEAFARALPLLCSINALAVLPDHRRKRYRVEGTDWEGSVGNLLLLSLFKSLEADYIKGAIATAGDTASLRFFARFGFQAIDRPAINVLHTLPMTNIGLVFGSPAHLRTQDTCRFDPNMHVSLAGTMRALECYFSERQAYTREDDPAELVHDGSAGETDERKITT